MTDSQDYSKILPVELVEKVLSLPLEDQKICNQIVCQNDIAYFASRYLKDELPLRIPEFHKEIYNYLIDWKIDRLAIIAPTGFAKTTVCLLVYPTYIACYNLCKRIILISNTASFAERRLRDIKTIFESNTRIRDEFNITPGDIWRDNEITLSNGVNILALGAGSQITGERPDLIIADDIETEEQVKSEVMRSSLNYWWDATVMNRPATDGRVIIIGSISSPLAFLNRFKKEPHNKIWSVKDYFTKECKTIWPEKWSNIFLEKKKMELSATPGLYEALYESDTSQISKYTFRKEWLRYYDKAPEGLAVFTVVDPAIGERVDNDFTAIITGGIDLYGNIFVLDVIKKRFNLDTLEMFGALFTIYEVHRPVRIGFESVAFQKYIKLFFESECKKRGKFPSVVEIKHDSKVTKAMRISSLAPLAQAGNLFIKADMYDLISEWEAYPEVSHDDVVDALSMLKDMAMPMAMSANKGTPHRYQPRNQYINV